MAMTDAVAVLKTLAGTIMEVRMVKTVTGERTHTTYTSKTNSH
jgi:hypothetical protein